MNAPVVASASSVPLQEAYMVPIQSNSATPVAENYQRISKILSDIGCSSKLHLFEENELDDDLLDDMTEEHFALAGLSSDEVIMFRKRLGSNAAANASVEIDEETQMLRDMEAMMQALEQKSSFVASPAAASEGAPSKVSESASPGLLDSFSGVGRLFSGISFGSGSREAASDGAEAPAAAADSEDIGFGKKLLSFKFGSKDTESGSPTAAAPAAASESEGFGKKLFSGFGSFGKK